MDKEMLDFMARTVQAFADGAIAGYLDKENIESNPYDGFLRYSWEDGFKYGTKKERAPL
jgi:hypothetical protein